MRVFCRKISIERLQLNKADCTRSNRKGYQIKIITYLQWATIGKKNNYNSILTKKINCLMAHRLICKLNSLASKKIKRISNQKN